MQKVNKVSVFLLFFGYIIAATLQSCQKYEDGPTLSLLSRAERVANTWKVDNYTVNTGLLIRYGDIRLPVDSSIHRLLISVRQSLHDVPTYESSDSNIVSRHKTVLD